MQNLNENENFLLEMFKLGPWLEINKNLIRYK